MVKHLARAERVFVLGIDGMRGPAVLEADAPNLRAFMKQAAWTADARTVVPSSSYQAWGSLFHGVGPEKHQCGASTPIREDVPWPSFMKVARQQHPDWVMGSICSWGPINDHIIEESCGCYKLAAGDLQATARSAAYIRDKRPQVFFLHLDNLDIAGHSYGYRSEEYRLCVSHQDFLVGQVLAAIDEIDPAGKSAVMIVSDHGGCTTSQDDKTWHGHGSDHEDCVRVFWSCRAPGVAAGRELGAGISIMDTCAAAAEFLGLPRAPGWDARVPEGL